MATVKGNLIIWGIDAVVSTGAITSYYPTSLSTSLSGDEAEIKGAQGEVESIVFTNDKRDMTFEVVPKGTVQATVNSSLTIPARGTKVTITSVVEGTGGATTNIAGDWMVVGGNIAQSNDGASKLVLNLRRYSGITL